MDYRERKILVTTENFLITTLRYTHWLSSEAQDTENGTFIDRDNVLTYLKRLSVSEPPPIEVIDVPGRGLLVCDGNHRVNASKLAGRTHIRGARHTLSYLHS